MWIRPERTRPEGETDWSEVRTEVMTQFVQTEVEGVWMVRSWTKPRSVYDERHNPYETRLELLPSREKQ